MRSSLNRAMWLLAIVMITGAAARADDQVAGPPSPGESLVPSPAGTDPQPDPSTNSAAHVTSRDAPARERKLLLPPGSKPPAGSTVLPAISGESGVMSLAAPLATVIGVILICALVLRRTFGGSGNLASAMGAGGKSPAGILEVLGRYPIARGHSLVLLRLDRRILLLSHSHGARGASAAFSTLAELSDPDDVASILLKVQEAEDKSAAKQFAELMSRARDGEGLPTEVEQGRTRRAATDGDAVEMWNDLRAPASPSPAAPSPRQVTASDPVRALRERIAAMKGGNASSQEVAA
jgi:hypothetical protein